MCGFAQDLARKLTARNPAGKSNRETGDEALISRVTLTSEEASTLEAELTLDETLTLKVELTSGVALEEALTSDTDEDD
jgi:hypothetical protein